MSRIRDFPIGSEEGLAAARMLIADAASKGTQRLDLSRLGLTQVPEELLQFEQYDLRKLTTLGLDSNRIEEIPVELGLLPNLTSLSISGNQLTELPVAIPQLVKLRALACTGNRLTNIPGTIGQLTALENLVLDNNQLTSLPDSIGQLSSLTSLKVGYNLLTVLPDTLGELSTLHILWLNSNKLVALPKTIGQLANLGWLRLDSNQLTVLPESIGQLSCLDTLNLSHSKLTSLPDTIGQLSELTSLWLAGNRLATLPKSITKLSKLQELYIENNPFAPDIQQALDNGGLGALAVTLDRASKSRSPQPFVRPFPEPDTVFAEPVARYARHLHPLVSIDLSAVDPALSGWIHLVSPIEPFDGYLGDSGKAYWGPYLQPNWIGFRLTAEHRYELLGDFRFFGIENIGGKDGSEGVIEDLEAHYKEMHASFAEHKAAYIESGHVCRVRNHGNPQRVATLKYLGGEAPAGNTRWSEVPDVAFTYSDDDSAPRTADGRLYKFIAAVPGWHYRRGGADCILLYYDPVERIALQTFAFT